jgi:hypothetical protein
MMMLYYSRYHCFHLGMICMPAVAKHVKISCHVYLLHGKKCVIMKFHWEYIIYEDTYFNGVVTLPCTFVSSWNSTKNGYYEETCFRNSGRWPITSADVYKHTSTWKQQPKFIALFFRKLQWWCLYYSRYHCFHFCSNCNVVFWRRAVGSKI